MQPALQIPATGSEELLAFARASRSQLRTHLQQLLGNGDGKIDNSQRQKHALGSGTAAIKINKSLLIRKCPRYAEGIGGWHGSFHRSSSPAYVIVLVGRHATSKHSPLPRAKQPGIITSAPQQLFKYTIRAST